MHVVSYSLSAPPLLQPIAFSAGDRMRYGYETPCADVNGTYIDRYCGPRVSWGQQYAGSREWDCSPDGGYSDYRSKMDACVAENLASMLRARAYASLALSANALMQVLPMCMERAHVHVPMCMDARAHVHARVWTRACARAQLLFAEFSAGIETLTIDQWVRHRGLFPARSVALVFYMVWARRTQIPGCPQITALRSEHTWPHRHRCCPAGGPRMLRYLPRPRLRARRGPVCARLSPHAQPLHQLPQLVSRLYAALGALHQAQVGALVDVRRARPPLAPRGGTSMRTHPPPRVRLSPRAHAPWTRTCTCRCDVFLSYRVGSELAVAEELYKKLTAAGVEVWWDKRSLKNGLK